MTYTYKLARRLAILRDLVMLPALVLSAACMGETTGPESGPRPSTPAALSVVPSAVTIETNQPVRFRAEGEPSSAEPSSTAVSWNATGGSINAYGIFSATKPGRYKVVGRTRGGVDPDTSLVIVIYPPIDVSALVISPDSATVPAGGTHTFKARGRLLSGRRTQLGVLWSATGGRVDPAGVYRAGTVAGTYRVVARNLSGTLADTATVVITSADSPEPEPPTTPGPDPQPEPDPDPTPVPPLPTLSRVVVTPGNVTLATSGTFRFAAYGRNTTGDSVGVTVEFKATGGTINARGLYTAGQTPGAYRVIATTSGLSDTAEVTLTRALGSGGGRTGIPYGPSQMLGRAGGVPAPFTMTADATTPTDVITRIGRARLGGYKLLLNMTGGSHRQYMSLISGVEQFDEAKWYARMDLYNTPAIKAAVAEAVADGTIIGNIVMDEPHVSGGGDGNTWGPRGTMTKLRVDGLCRYVKEMFPTLPAGVFHQHDTFEPDRSYQVCDFITAQYNWRRGDVTRFRDAALALGRRDGHAVMFSLNILNGGVQDKDGNWDCSGTGGLGTFSPNCRMTPDQVRNYGLILGPAGCGLYMWRYDEKFATDPENQQAFKDVAAKLATLPAPPCTRS